MATTNVKARVPKKYTHEGAEAYAHLTPLQELRRSVLSCMLWEGEFYEDGESIAKRIAELIPKVAPEDVAALAIQARSQYKLRHVPLLLARELARNVRGRPFLVRNTIEQVIQRADELAEFLAIYWKDDPNQSLSAQVKLGLAAAFNKFDAYQLDKYNRDDKKVKLRDVMFLSHPKPNDVTEATPGHALERKYKSSPDSHHVLRHHEGKSNTWAELAEQTLKSPDTWEVALSAGANKSDTFQRMMAEKTLGALAFLRNLRNMKEAGVPKAAVAFYAQQVDISRVLPFRFISAARAVPAWEDLIEPMMLRACDSQTKLSGKTVLVIDTSGSMHHGTISGKSDLSRVDAAKALAMLLREICEESVIYATAGNDYKRVHATIPIPNRRGFALGDSIFSSDVQSKIGGGGIYLRQCMDFIYGIEKSADRIIVLTDEVDCDNKLAPATANAFGKKNYLINVASAKNGIGYGKWVHIDGFSEAVISYIRELESMENSNA